MSVQSAYTQYVVAETLKAFKEGTHRTLRQLRTVQADPGGFGDEVEGTAHWTVSFKDEGHFLPWLKRVAQTLEDRISGVVTYVVRRNDPRKLLKQTLVNVEKKDVLVIVDYNLDSRMAAVSSTVKMSNKVVPCHRDGVKKVFLKVVELLDSQRKTITDIGSDNIPENMRHALKPTVTAYLDLGFCYPQQGGAINYVQLPLPKELMPKDQLNAVLAGVRGKAPTDEVPLRVYMKMNDLSNPTPHGKAFRTMNYKSIAGGAAGVIEEEYVNILSRDQDFRHYRFTHVGGVWVFEVLKALTYSMYKPRRPCVWSNDYWSCDISDPMNLKPMPYDSEAAQLTSPLPVVDYCATCLNEIPVSRVVAGDRIHAVRAAYSLLVLIHGPEVRTLLMNYFEAVGLHISRSNDNTHFEMARIEEACLRGPLVKLKSLPLLMRFSTSRTMCPWVLFGCLRYVYQESAIPRDLWAEQNLMNVCCRVYGEVDSYGGDLGVFSAIIKTAMMHSRRGFVRAGQTLAWAWKLVEQNSDDAKMLTMVLNRYDRTKPEEVVRRIRNVREVIGLLVSGSWITLERNLGSQFPYTGETVSNLIGFVLDLELGLPSNPINLDEYRADIGITYTNLTTRELAFDMCRMYQLACVHRAPKAENDGDPKAHWKEPDDDGGSSIHQYQGGGSSAVSSEAFLHAPTASGSVMTVVKACIDMSAVPNVFLSSKGPGESDSTGVVILGNSANARIVESDEEGYDDRSNPVKEQEEEMFRAIRDKFSALPNPGTQL